MANAQKSERCTGRGPGWRCILDEYHDGECEPPVEQPKKSDE